MLPMKLLFSKITTLKVQAVYKVCQDITLEIIEAEIEMLQAEQAADFARDLSMDVVLLEADSSQEGEVPFVGRQGIIFQVHRW
ncbi:hypothetical protein MRB53_011317 [Persea americana]|uniref:Uncharacterized protein n=1 Tax=Persea americana TaxID=3435 RepID=A0ACC2LUF4_PERAE|nr:hypothetical protein MRB53_011317 [Persea americana]